MGAQATIFFYCLELYTEAFGFGTRLTCGGFARTRFGMSSSPTPLIIHCSFCLSNTNSWSTVVREPVSGSETRLLGRGPLFLSDGTLDPMDHLILLQSKQRLWSQSTDIKLHFISFRIIFIGLKLSLVHQTMRP